MHRSSRRLGALALGALVTLGLGACGSSSPSPSSGKPAAGANSHGAHSITYLMGTAPDYLDPQLGITTQSAEATWLAYLGLYSYAHASGKAGTRIIPALATALPRISPDGKTYTMALRHGLRYSNGAPVKAGDFAFAIERAIKLNWNNKQFFTQNIVGASAFDKGQAKTISGITSDASGRITVRLLAPYGAFPNVMAYSAAGLIPAGTPLSNQTNHPPPGVGPYVIANVVPNQSFSEIRNPRWAAQAIPGIPAGHVDVSVKILSNTQTEADTVLGNSADVFDWGDTIPPATLAQIRSQAANRYAAESTPLTLYFFLNAKTKPFSNQLAREAVNYALDRRALSRLDSGNLAPNCYFLPPGLVGHPAAPCPYGDPTRAPDLTRARQLVTQSGMAGTPVTVWGQTRSPRKEYVDYYASVLNSIGFKATERIVADSTYFATIGNVKTNAQTGFADWQQDFPNPIDFYQLLDAKSIQATGNNNYGLINDPHIESSLGTLGRIPSANLDSVSGAWTALDQYTAQKAYLAVFGYELVPKLFSARMDFGAAVFHPLYGNDWSSLRIR